MSIQSSIRHSRSTRAAAKGISWSGSLTWLAVVISFVHASTAQAQARDLDTYALAPLQAGSLLSVWGSSPIATGRYALGLGMQVRPPLSNEQAATGSAPNAGAISTLELLATVGFWRGMDISGGITAFNGSLDGSNSRDTQSSAALGDLRLIPRLRLLGGDSGAGLALAIPIWIPAGNASAYSAQGIRFEPRALTSYYSKYATLSASAGYLFSRSSAEQEWSAITGGIGADVPVIDTWSVVMELASRWQLHDRGAAPGTRLPVEARAAVRFSQASWVVQLGGGIGLLGGASQPDWRLLASVGFRAPEVQRTETAKPPSDHDRGVDPCRSEGGPGLGDVGDCPLEPEEPGEFAAEPSVEVAEETPSAVPPIEAATDAPLLPIREILYFELNRMDLDATQLAVLDLVEAQLRSSPADAELVIEGHSDSIGPPPFNSSLSRMRASTVRLYLIQRGIPWRRLLITSYGSSRPVEPDVDRSGRARNRRVEFRLVRKHQAKH